MNLIDRVHGVEEVDGVDRVVVVFVVERGFLLDFVIAIMCRFS